MAIYLIAGEILTEGGAIAVSADCCCADSCCADEADATLYLTIDNFTLDGGETCDAGCIFEVTAYTSFGGAVPRDGASWLGDGSPDPDEVVPAYDIQCTAGVWVLDMFSGGYGFVMNNDATDQLCYVRLDPNQQTLGTNPTCNPFYLQATVDIIVYEGDGVTQCGTGTMRVTITE